MGRPAITKAQYEAIKMLLNSTSMTMAQIANVVGLGVGSVDRVAPTKDFESFCDKRLEESRRYNKPRKESAGLVETEPQKPQEVVKEVRQTVTIQATHFMMQELQKMNNLLTLISNKLGFIVDELCGTVKKDG